MTPMDADMAAKKAFAGGDLAAAPPNIKHFNLLEDAAHFLQKANGRCRALGFFGADLAAPEHTVFLTVAKTVTDDAHPLAVQLARATVGRKATFRAPWLLDESLLSSAAGAPVATRWRSACSHTRGSACAYRRHVRITPCVSWRSRQCRSADSCRPRRSYR